MRATVRNILPLIDLADAKAMQSDPIKRAANAVNGYALHSEINECRSVSECVALLLTVDPWLALQAFNGVLDGHGVERTTLYDYVNLGDQYLTTICMCIKNKGLTVTDLDTYLRRFGH